MYSASTLGGVSEPRIGGASRIYRQLSIFHEGIDRGESPRLEGSGISPTFADRRSQVRLEVAFAPQLQCTSVSGSPKSWLVAYPDETPLSATGSSNPGQEPSHQKQFR